MAVWDLAPLAPDDRIALCVKHRDDNRALRFVTIQDDVGEPPNKQALNPSFDVRMHMRLCADAPDRRPQLGEALVAQSRALLFVPIVGASDVQLGLLDDDEGLHG